MVRRQQKACAAGKKAAQTKAANKRAKEDEAKKDGLPRKPGIKDWLAWGMSTGKINIVPAHNKGFRIIWQEKGPKPTQAEIASNLFFVLGESVAQQRVGEMCQKVKSGLTSICPCQT